MGGLEIDFIGILIADIDESDFKTTTTFPFPCPIFRLCRDAEVLSWHCDNLIWRPRFLTLALFETMQTLFYHGGIHMFTYLPWVLILVRIWSKFLLMRPSYFPLLRMHRFPIYFHYSGYKFIPSNSLFMVHYSSCAPCPDVRDADGYSDAAHEAVDVAISG